MLFLFILQPIKVPELVLYLEFVKAYIIPEDYNIPISSFKQVNIQNMQKFYNNEKKNIRHRRKTLERCVENLTRDMYVEENG